jgi:ribosome-binding factor A
MASPKTIARLEAQIQRRVAHCLQFELADPRAGFITVTRVELSRDISGAKVFYSVLGEAGDERMAAMMLEQASSFVQRQVASVLRTRTVPRLTWYFDASVRDAARIDLLIREARARDHEIGGDQAADTANEDDPEQ